MSDSLANSRNVDELPTAGGFMRYYGLYWRKDFLYEKESLLPGLPQGWLGSGNIKEELRNQYWVNFWGQKGVYVLYNRDLHPVYSGQAGLEKKSKSKSAGRTLGERLRDHKTGKYRNGWEYFSWFGFLDLDDSANLKGKLKSATSAQRSKPDWTFNAASNDANQLSALLNAFEAILIEAFSPRFNARGGNLKGTTYVDQLEFRPDAIGGPQP